MERKVAQQNKNLSEELKRGLPGQFSLTKMGKNAYNNNKNELIFSLCESYRNTLKIFKCERYENNQYLVNNPLTIYDCCAPLTAALNKFIKKILSSLPLDSSPEGSFKTLINRRFKRHQPTQVRA